MEHDVSPAETLKRRLKRLREEELEVKRDLASVAKSSVQRQAYRGGTGFTHLEEHIASSIVLQEHGSYNCAVTYLLRMQCRSHHVTMPPRTRADLTTALTSCFDGLPVHIVQHLNHPVGDRWIKIGATAKRYLNEFKLRAWIIKQNVLKGLAPPSSEVGTYFDNFIIAGQPVGAIPFVPRSDMTLIGNRRWMQRFRDRWNISLGKVASRDIVSPIEISEKVSKFRGGWECALFGFS